MGKRGYLADWLLAFGFAVLVMGIAAVVGSLRIEYMRLAMPITIMLPVMWRIQYLSVSRTPFGFFLAALSAMVLAFVYTYLSLYLLDISGLVGEWGLALLLGASVFLTFKIGEPFDAWRQKMS